MTIRSISVTFSFTVHSFTNLSNQISRKRVTATSARRANFFLSVLFVFLRLPVSSLQNKQPMVRRYLLGDQQKLHCGNYLVFWKIRTCLGVSDDPMFLWISSHSCPLNSSLVWSHQVEIIIAKRPVQGRNNVTRVGVEPDLTITVVVKTTSLLS